MDQDENTLRGHKGPLAALAGPAASPRSTAPAGTPYPVAPNPPPPVPPPTASQPRTLGGHTARLLVPEDEPIEFDPLGSSSLPEPLPADHGGDAEPSTTVGGTQRLDPVSPEQAAVAKRDIAREEAEKKVVEAEKKPAPTIDMPVMDPAAAAPKVAEARADGEPTTLSLLLAPASVAVGLVFFAMGCMLALIFEGRLIRFSVTLPAEMVSATAPAPSGTGATHPAALSASATASHPPSAAASSVPSAPASPGKPPVGPGTGRGQGSGKLPPLPF